MQVDVTIEWIAKHLLPDTAKREFYAAAAKAEKTMARQEQAARTKYDTDTEPDQKELERERQACRKSYDEAVWVNEGAFDRKTKPHFKQLTKSLKAAKKACRAVMGRAFIEACRKVDA